MNLWECAVCNTLRMAPCSKACLPSDHYDPRDQRDAAAVLDFQDGFDE